MKNLQFLNGICGILFTTLFYMKSWILVKPQAFVFIITENTDFELISVHRGSIVQKLKLYIGL